MADTVTRVVTGVDTYAWNDGTQTRFADRGDTIEVTEAEANRIPGALSDPAEAAESLAAAPSGVWEQKSDEAIEAMTVEQVVAYLNTVPADYSDAEIDRVVDLEELRDRPRAGVMSLRTIVDDDNDDDDVG